jgi:ABC-type proline/glycine betaine transport system substrate-binding protein
MKLPISYIEEKQGENWKTLRVEVVIDDKDGKEIKRYYWQPTWMNKEINVIGSGMFFRE